MPPDSKTRWTDDRIQALVTPQFIQEQFKPDKRELLKRSISFGDIVNDHTYLHWILERAKRFFLVLQHVGVPERIFHVIDESFDDSDLPMTAQAVKDLQLSGKADATLDKKFYKAQFVYLVRDIKEGDHKRYLDDETVPVKVISPTSAIHRSGKDTIEKVHVAPSTTKVYGRKRIVLNGPPSNSTEADVLAEIDFAKNLAHEHVLSVFGSYTHANSVYVLLRPATEYTLSTFANNPPRHFENLPKPQRREMLLNWPHCLANGLTWLHANHRSHGAVRPSNILIDGEYQIYLGQIDGLTITQGNEKVGDIESYQYAAPERWKRAATVQKTVPQFVPLGRTVRRQNTAQSASMNDGEDGGYVPMGSSPETPIDISKPTNTAYAFIPTSRGGSARHHKRTGSSEYAASIRSSSSSGTGNRGIDSLRLSSLSNGQSGSRSGITHSASRSVLSSHGSGNRQNAVPNTKTVAVAPNDVKTTVVQMWQSAQCNPYAADVFALGAIIVDIMTFLCKRSASAFAKHRASKNRTAGRGGGAADASFHSNLGQVHTWTVSLEDDARKKASKAETKIFEAVAPILQVARECLIRTPEDRPEADAIEQSLEQAIRQFVSSTMAHCNVQSPSWIRKGDAAEASRSGYPSRQQSSATVRDSGKRSNKYGNGKAPMLPEIGQTRGVSQMDPRASSSLAKFDFGYERSEDRSYPPSMSSAGFSAEEIISLSAIPGRHGLRNGGEPARWSHLRSDPRDSIVSSDTQAMSMTEEEEMDLMNNYFHPRTSPPSLLPGLPDGARAGRTPPSRGSPVTSNTARKRVDTLRPESARHSTKDGRKHQQGTDPVRPRTTSNLGPGVKDDGNVSPEEDDEELDDEGNRGRRSVSTLASTSSTIRLSWQQRDVSPMSLGDTRASTATSTSFHFGDEDEPESKPEPPRTTNFRSPSEASRRVEVARSGRIYSPLKRTEVLIKSSPEIGPKKPGSTSSKKGGLVSRYSFLSGMM